MNCRDVTGLLADYLAGEIRDDLREAFDAHLSRCENCRVFLAQYRAVIEASAVSARDAWPELPPALVDAVRASLARIEP